jgi:ABC-2 type transport system permease protein
MSLSRRRVRGIARKELREYRRNRSLIAGMAVLPLVFAVQPLAAVLALDAKASGALAHEHVLLYLLGIPVLVPVIIAASAIAGERQQGTLEPALTTPIRREELLIGKALAVLLPSLAIAYAVFVLFLGLILLLARPGIAPALIQGPDLAAQILFTPLLATWSILVGMAVSTRSSDVRVAQQLGFLANIPAIAVVVLTALNVIPATPALAIGGAALLLALDGVGWRVVSRLFERERLITGA